MNELKSIVLGPDFFERSALVVARELIGKTLVRKVGRKTISSVITETEAYIGPRDLAAHSSKGRTARTEVMFGPPGRWYVFFTYGIHWMLNVVTGKAGHAAAVLIRGTVAVSGPARLAKYFAVDKRLNGLAAHPASGLWIEDQGIVLPRGAVRRTPRTGIDYAGPIWAPKPYRFVAEGRLLTVPMQQATLKTMSNATIRAGKKSKKRSGGG